MWNICLRPQCCFPLMLIKYSKESATIDGFYSVAGLAPRILMQIENSGNPGSNPGRTSFFCTFLLIHSFQVAIIRTCFFIF